MEFGIGIDTHVNKWDLVRYAEELGYDRAWVPDSQMIWSDCYATLALAAANTRRIKIGTGVAIAGTRIAPVTAHSIATINQLAPGRTFLGVGTGHRDACDGAEPDAGGRVQRVRTGAARTFTRRGGRLHFSRPHA